MVCDGTTIGLRLGADFPRDEAEGALVREGVLSFLRSGAEAGYPDARTALAFLERFFAVRAGEVAMKGEQVVQKGAERRRNPANSETV